MININITNEHKEYLINTVLKNKGSNNNQKKAAKIIIIRSLPRVTVNGLHCILTSDTTGLAYDSFTGTFYRVKNLKDGWEVRRRAHYKNTKTYDQLEVFGLRGTTNTNNEMGMQANVLACIIEGLYDNIDESMVEYYDSNHKNWNTHDNYIDNLEVVLKCENMNHCHLHSIIKKMGWEPVDYSLTADQASKALKEANGDCYKLKNILKI